MGVWLGEEPQLKIARFIRVCDLNVANEVDQIYSFFGDVCELTINVKRQLKRRKFFQISFMKIPSNYIEIKAPIPYVKVLGKVKGIANDVFK